MEPQPPPYPPMTDDEKVKYWLIGGVAFIVLFHQLVFWLVKAALPLELVVVALTFVWLTVKSAQRKARTRAALAPVAATSSYHTPWRHLIKPALVAFGALALLAAALSQGNLSGQ